MKTLASITLCFLLLTGCTLFPKSVELFQKKVEAVPEVSDKSRETQKQAARYAAQTAQETLEAAIKADSPLYVEEPARATARVATGLSESLGPPANPWSADYQALVEKLRTQEARFSKELDKYREEGRELEGKKIEGSGFFQFGYFTQWWFILVGGLVVWAGLKVYGSVNPVVGLGTKVIGRISSKTLKTGFEQLTHAGEVFKDGVSKLALSPEDVQAVKDLFRMSHERSQDKEIQELVTKLT
jgi:hypothetical protein